MDDGNQGKAGRPPKFDYDGDDFYDDIYDLARQGMSDAEIADSLGEMQGNSLTPEVFNTMKNGRYAQWTDEQNKIRSERINKVLTRGRRRILTIIRGAYLKSALGGKKIKNRTIRYVQNQCICGGHDPDCDMCGGTGVVVSSSKSIVEETEVELAPNNQALGTLLYHWDKEWKKVERKEDNDDDIPTNIRRGIPVKEWVKSKLGK